MSRREGPIEAREWPGYLSARAVDRDTASIFGYSIPDDIARHGYKWSDLVLLCLTGTLPSDEDSRRFELALLLLAPVSVADAPSHASTLAALGGARSGAVAAVASLALGEQAHRKLISMLRELETWGEDVTAPLPETLLASSSEEEKGTRRVMENSCRGFIDARLLHARPSRMTLALTLLRASGLHGDSQIVWAYVLAGLPACLAEARLVRAGDFSEYPINVPPIVYSSEE